MAKKTVAGRIAVPVCFFVSIIYFIVSGYAVWFFVRMNRQEFEHVYTQLASSVAIMTERQFDFALQSRILKPSDIFDNLYVEVEGFDFSLPKFFTKYSYYLNASMLSLLDKISTDEVAFIAILNRDGLVTALDSSWQADPVKHPEKNMMGIMATDGMLKKLAASDVMQIVHENAAPFIPAQQYAFRWLKEYNEYLFYAPIFVRAKHWGGVVIGIKPGVLLQVIKVEVAKIVIAGLLIALLTGMSIYFMVKKRLAPVISLVDAAERLSIGDLDEPVGEFEEKEIDQLAKALERLRISLRAAIKRIKGGNR